MTEIVNLTPHVVHYISEGDGPSRAFKPEEKSARVEEEVVPTGEVDGMKTVLVQYGEVVGLPESKPGVFYIVSTMVFEAVGGRHSDREDLLVPVDFVRDDTGRIVGCRAFRRY